LPGQFGGPAGEVPAILFLPAKILRRLKNNRGFWLAFFLNQSFMIVPSNKTTPQPSHDPPPTHTHPLVFLCVRAHYPAARHNTKRARNKRSTAQTKAPNVRTHQKEACEDIDAAFDSTNKSILEAAFDSTNKASPVTRYVRCNLIV
jgi:hypothetical protein